MKNLNYVSMILVMSLATSFLGCSKDDKKKDDEPANEITDQL